LLDEADRLLDNISSAWREIDPRPPQARLDSADAPAAARFFAGA